MAHRLPLLLALLSTAVAAQTATVRGVVRDAGGAALPGASVYLSGTTRGAASDAEGRFEIADVLPGGYRLVGSLVGYEPDVREVRLAAGARAVLDLQLGDATAALGDVRVEAPTDRRWQKRLAWFATALLGESANAAETAILNPWVLDFRLRWGTLRATAAAPLEIENRALGYRLVYDLHDFSASTTHVSYDGDERFEALDPATPDEAARWAEARERAYRGSDRHLFRALLAGREREEGFTLTLTREDPFYGGPQQPRPARGVMRADTAGWGTLRVRGRLDVVYDREGEEPAYLGSEWFRERRARPDPAQRSSIRVERGRARIDPQGTPEDPFAVTTSGYLAFERLADLVPEEYGVDGGLPLTHERLRTSRPTLPVDDWVGGSGGVPRHERPATLRSSAFCAIRPAPLLGIPPVDSIVRSTIPYRETASQGALPYPGE